MSTEQLTTKIYACAKATAQATIMNVRRRLLDDRSDKLPELTDEGVRELARISAELAMGQQADLLAEADDRQIVRWFAELFAEELSRVGVDI